MAMYPTTYDWKDHAGAVNFDDSAWEKVKPEQLSDLRGGGRVSFLWYRTTLTIPDKVKGQSVAGTIAVMTIMIDDYSEIWVDGQVARRNGVPSPATIQGYDMPNRVVLSSNVKPGQTYHIAVFAINGPISRAPDNFVFFREAKMEFITQDPLEKCCH